jgi:hypothetical protein
MLTPIDYPYENEELVLADGTVVALARQATKRWLAGRVLYELESGQYVLVDHATGKVSSAAIVDEHRALEALIEVKAELPEKLQRLPEVSKGRDHEPPPRDVSHWGGRGLLNWATYQSAHDVVIPDLIKEVVLAGVVLVQQLRDPPEENSKRRSEISHFIGALFGQYSVDPDRWWGPTNCVPPKTVGILDLQWPYGSEDLKATVTELQALVEPPLSCMKWKGWFGDPNEPTPEEQLAANEGLNQSAPQIEELIVRLRQQLAKLMAGDATEELRLQGIVKVPSDDAFLAYGIYKFAGRKQADVAVMIGRATGGTSNQGTVSRWVNEVEQWLAAKNSLPPMTLETVCRAFATDPAILDLGRRGDGRTPRQRPESDDS